MSVHARYRVPKPLLQKKAPQNKKAKIDDVKYGRPLNVAPASRPKNETPVNSISDGDTNVSFKTSSSSSSSLDLQPVAMTERDKSRFTEGSVNIGGSVDSILD
ncbi:hypothetical protein EVAR_77632_1 [Eumeta japonica]|uniref:Uncharacterized protein n=1 Tax=Eumeta variegata TaxID=151549 RepID=A0A4C1TAA9_EUMVA|nr:hypothetical protein EVAR_77632_1 [Eumeta japonica]